MPAVESPLRYVARMARYRTFDIDPSLLLEAHPQAVVAGIPGKRPSFEAFGLDPHNIVELLSRPDWNSLDNIALVEIEDAREPRFYLAMPPKGKLSTDIDVYPLNYLRLSVRDFGPSAGAFEAREMLESATWSAPDANTDTDF